MEFACLLTHKLFGISRGSVYYITGLISWLVKSKWLIDYNFKRFRALNSSATEQRFGPDRSHPYFLMLLYRLINIGQSTSRFLVFVRAIGWNRRVEGIPTFRTQNTAVSVKTVYRELPVLRFSLQFVPFFIYERRIHCIYYTANHSTEKNHSWKACSRSDSQEISRILWNSKIHYRIHKHPQPDINLINMNPVHTLPSTSLWPVLILSCHLSFSVV